MDFSDREANTEESEVLCADNENNIETESNVETPLTKSPSTVRVLCAISIMFGILSLAIFNKPLISIICVVFGIVSGIIAILEAKEIGAKYGAAIAGITCSCVGIIYCVRLIILNTVNRFFS